MSRPSTSGPAPATSEQRTRPLHGRFGLSRSRLVIAAVLLALAIVSAAGSAGRLSRATPAARVTQPSPDAPQSPGAGQPLTVAVAVGPHLSVPVFYYHYIRTIVPTAHNVLGFNLSISAQRFAQQMALLYVEGAHSVTIGTLMAALAGRATLPPHPVVLTFDDGYADFATAAEPVLVSFGFVATDFVVSGFVGRRSYMTADQVRTMDAAGMVIGSHTMHHVDLARVSPATARAEIDGGKAALEQLLGHAVLDFAYPYGGFNAAVVQLVRQAGFRDAASTIYGDTQTLNGAFLLQRMEIGGAPSLARFARAAGFSPPTSSQSSLIASLTAPGPSLKGA